MSSDTGPGDVLSMRRIYRARLVDIPVHETASVCKEVPMGLICTVKLVIAGDSALNISSAFLKSPEVAARTFAIAARLCPYSVTTFASRREAPDACHKLPLLDYVATQPLRER